MRLSEADHARVTEAVAAAEKTTDGEIVTIVAGQSDAYHDVALHWSILAMLLVMALLAWQPGVAGWFHGLVADPWAETAPLGGLYFTALILLVLTFLAMRVVLAWQPLRMLLTPGTTKTRRVHRRAMILFRIGTEKRTRAATGVLLYLSLDEHRAEIVADEAIHSKVSPDVWGEAMAALIVAVKEGRPGDGMAEAVRQIGIVLAAHFPRSIDDTNELSDRLIEL